ncbi:MAG: hypothetical protein WCI05_07905 [Myxococcales bacterium]
MQLRATPALTHEASAAVRVAIGLVLVGLAAYVAAFFYCAACRLTFPFDLEWMEGGMLTHSARLLRGEPIYASPSSDFVAFFYTPLYARVVAVLSQVTGGLSFTVGRAVSLVSTVATFAMLFHAGRREAGWLAGVVAVGLYAALFRTVGTFFDLARIDALALALGFGASLVAYEVRTTRGAMAAALLFVLAFFTKQTAAVVAPFVGLHLLMVDRRRAMVFGVVGAIFGIALGVFEDAASREWFRFYVIQGHQGHSFYWRNFVLEYWRDLLFLCPFVVLVPTLGASYGKRTRWAVVAFLGLLVVAFAQRVGTLAYDHHMYFSDLWYENPRWRLVVPPTAMATLLIAVRVLGAKIPLPSPYFLWLCVGGAFASGLNHSTQWAYSNCFMPVAVYASLYAALVFAKGVEHTATSGGRLGAVAFAGALLVQLVALVYDPRMQVPRGADWRALAEFERVLARFPGPVFVPAHPMYSYLRDGTVHMHQMGIGDVAFAGGIVDLSARLASGAFPTVVQDTDCAIAGLAESHVAVHRFQYDGLAFLLRTGFAVRPATVWVHRDILAKRPELRSVP